VQLLEVYVDNAVKSVNDVVTLQKMTGKTSNASLQQFQGDLITLNDFGNNLSIDNFFDSIEYQYVLKHMPIRTNFRRSEDKNTIDVAFDGGKLSFELQGDCEFKGEQAVTSETTFLDSLFTLGASDMTNYYNQYACETSSGDLVKIKTFSEKLNSLNAYNKLVANQDWNYRSRSSRTTDYHYNRAASSSSTRPAAPQNLSKYLSQDGVWIKLQCNNGDEKTIRDCKDGYYAANSYGVGGCHHKGRQKAAEFACDSSGGF
jgi:hypothetical protein